MSQPSYSYSLFSRNDYSAFWALFTDNLINLLVLSGVCQFVFGMPAQMAGLAAGYGAAFGLLPIGWIVLNII